MWCRHFHSLTDGISVEQEGQRERLKVYFQIVDTVVSRS